MIDIRRCTASEVPALMAFIDTHWKQGHALAINRPLMDWQHKAENNHYNYLLAWEGRELLGVLGYIPTHRYDPALKSENTLWLALWKIRPDCKVTALGLRMLRALEQVEPHTALAVNGINLTHPPMYKALGYKCAELTQHYMINPERPRHLLQGEGPFPTPATGTSTCTDLTESDLKNLILNTPATPKKTPQKTPQKTPNYFIERFLRHPFYRYHVYLLQHHSHQALIATRLATHEGRHALRIVDITGDPQTLAQSGTALLGLMQQHNAEYIDFWQHGIPPEILTQAGFAPVDNTVTVPNFFEPFVPKNGRILCAYKTKADNVIICRADGDQDRPSQLEPA